MLTTKIAFQCHIMKQVCLYLLPLKLAPFFIELETYVGNILVYILVKACAHTQTFRSIGTGFQPLPHDFYK